MMEALRSFETSVLTRTTQRNNPEDRILDIICVADICDEVNFNPSYSPGAESYVPLRHVDMLTHSTSSVCPSHLSLNTDGVTVSKLRISSRNWGF
jgi:hypothetical protein